MLPRSGCGWESLLRYRSSIFLQTDGMISAFLHLMKIMPALPEVREASVASEPPTWSSW